ncbi:MAG: hypothetical protein WBW33_24615 [Bryobacteraceae bacterium]
MTFSKLEFHRRRLLRFCIGLFVTAVAVVPTVRAGDYDLDEFKVRITGMWFFTNPTGTVQASGSDPLGNFNLTKDFGFNSYSTLTGKVDWKFTHKNHLYLAVSPFSQSHTSVLNRTIDFQGQTFEVGLTTTAKLTNWAYAPGYQYDIIRRDRGHLGIAVQIDLFDTTAKLSAAAQVTGDGTQTAAKSVSASLLAPIPLAGPDFRFYILPKFYVDGNLFGMYLFGYGNFLSTVDTVGVYLGKHVSLRAGYQLGQRLVVNNNSTTRIGINLTQKGPVAGVEFSL